MKVMQFDLNCVVVTAPTLDDYETKRVGKNVYKMFVTQPGISEDVNLEISGVVAPDSFKLGEEINITVKQTWLPTRTGGSFTKIQLLSVGTLK